MFEFSNSLNGVQLLAEIRSTQIPRCLNCSVIYSFSPWCLGRIFQFWFESKSHTKSHSYNFYIRPPNLTKYTVVLGLNPLLLVQKSASLALSNSYYCFLCSLTVFFVFTFSLFHYYFQILLTTYIVFTESS